MLTWLVSHLPGITVLDCLMSSVLETAVLYISFLGKTIDLVPVTSSRPEAEVLMSKLLTFLNLCFLNSFFKNKQEYSAYGFTVGTERDCVCPPGTW